MMFGRVPVTLVEIDQRRCALEWADTNAHGTCTATEGPCWNTLKTCQAREDYTDIGEPLTLRFSKVDAQISADYLPAIPSLVSVSTSPTRINVGGRSGTDKPLGRRAELRITFKDHPYSDLLTDPYVASRSYDPLERGTFWGKWLSRNPFYEGMNIRLIQGYEGQTIGEMQTRHYVITRIDGPNSSGMVQVRAQDVLSLADDATAQCPVLSRGSLLADISDADTGMTVTGETLAHYTGYSTDVVRIGDEVIEYTGISENIDGDIEFTGMVRGARNTEASSHDAGDTVQACLEITSTAPWAVARDLLQDFGNIDSSLIPFAAWEAECDVWLAGLTVSRLLTEPEGVTTLLGELSEQCMFYIWWDDVDREIKLRAVRPEIDQPPLITEQGNIVADSARIEVKPEMRASEVWFSFLPRKPTRVSTDRQDYRRTRARIAQTDYPDRRVYEVFSGWLETNLQVDLSTARLLARYRRIPSYFHFALDPKDRWLGLGDVFDVEYRGFTDDTGAIERVRYQVISQHEPAPGEMIKIEAQRFDYDVDQRFGRWMRNDAPVYTSADETDKATGCFWAADDGTMSNGDSGYVWA